MISDNYEVLRQLGNGVTVAFSKAYNMISASYARVYFEDAVTGIQTPQLSGWSISLSPSGGWTVTFSVAPTSDVYVVIGRSIDITQTDPYRTSRGWQGEVVENSFDKITGITQDLYEQLSRALVLPLGDAASPLLPSAAARANKTFIFDSAGNASAGSITEAIVSAAMEPVVNAATTAVAAALLGALTTAPGAVANSNLATMAANTVKANATSGVASPTDIALALNELLGRGASGNLGAITLGAGLSMVGSALTASAGGVTINIQPFTGSGTYTPTAGMDFCIVALCGAGGGGGAGDRANAVGGGGGAGGIAIEFYTAATIGASQSVTIGVGGTAGTSGVPNGTGGGTSSFGALMSASGGGAGTGSSSTTTNTVGGLGGVGSNGTINFTGQAGACGVNNTVGGLGGGMGGGRPTVNGAGGNGSNGGGGAGSSNGANAGAGGNGWCFVIEFI